MRVGIHETGDHAPAAAVHLVERSAGARGGPCRGEHDRLVSHLRDRPVPAEKRPALVRGHQSLRRSRQRHAGILGREDPRVAEEREAHPPASSSSSRISSTWPCVESRSLEVVRRGIEHRGCRDHAVDFGLRDLDAPGPRLGAHPLQREMDRGHLVVGEVHAHLHHSPVRELDGHGFHVRHPAARCPHGLRHGLRDFQVARGEVHVECDQEPACAHRGRAGAGVDARAADIRRAPGPSDLVAERLELTPADVLEPAAIGTGRGFLVEVHGNARFAIEAAAKLARDLDAFPHGDSPQWHERHHVHGADARVRAAVRAQVDRRRSRPGTPRAARRTPVRDSPTRLTTSRL